MTVRKRKVKRRFRPSSAALKQYIAETAQEEGVALRQRDGARFSALRSLRNTAEEMLTEALRRGR